MNYLHAFGILAHSLLRNDSLFMDTCGGGWTNMVNMIFSINYCFLRIWETVRGLTFDASESIFIWLKWFSPSTRALFSLGCQTALLFNTKIEVFIFNFEQIYKTSLLVGIRRWTGILFTYAQWDVFSKTKFFLFSDFVLFLLKSI